MVAIALIAWIPICAGLFAFTTPVRAVTLAYTCGWLILPMDGIPIAGFWDLEKVSSTNAGVVLGTILFSPGLFRGFRPCVADVALLGFACTTFLSFIDNGLGAYAGLSAFAQTIFRWGIPFWFGRAVLKNADDLKAAGLIVVVAASIYAVFALYEWRMSPQIHQKVYGSFQHMFSQHRRWGFYRPILCFPHALSLGMFMAWTSLLAITLYRAGAIHRHWGLPPWTFVALPIGGLMLSMSFSPWGLFLAGFGLLAQGRRMRSRIPLLVPVVFMAYWMIGRYTDVMDGRWTQALVAEISDDRANSLMARLDAEALLLDHAKTRPLLGWGGMGRNQVLKETGRAEYASDALWVILVGKAGLLGLCSFYLWWCWPVLCGIRAGESLEQDSVTMVLLMAIGLQCVNSLFNGVVSPILILLCGGAMTGVMRFKREDPPTPTAESSGSGRLGGVWRWPFPRA